MASRMDRYTKHDKDYPSARSDRNKSLYKQIEDLDSYTNIAGVATIESKNSIDIDKVKELLKDREAKKQKNIKEIKEKIEELEEPEEIKNYDINDLLLKARELSEKSEYRSLNSKQRNFLKTLNERNNKNKEESNDELNELVKTISDMKAIPADDPDDVGLFDDLKADTMVGDASSIKKIIEEEKELTKEFDDMKLDKSFYTSSFGFTQRDFEELKDINHKIKKSNKFIITLLIVLISLIIITVSAFVFLKTN